MAVSSTSFKRISLVVFLGLFLFWACSDKQTTTEERADREESSREAAPSPVPGKTDAHQPTAQGGAPSGVQAPSNSRASSDAPSGNHPPIIKGMAFEPASPLTGDTLKVNPQIEDADGDNLRITYRWKVNGEEVLSLAENTLEHSIKEGDSIEVEVVASDGTYESKPMSTSITVGNALPKIRLARQDLREDVYQAHLETSDPEGKPVTISLKTGPPGMVLKEGVLTWPVPRDAKGAFNVELSAQDTNGGEVLFGYQVRIERESIPAQETREGGRDNGTQS